MSKKVIKGKFYGTDIVTIAAGGAHGVASDTMEIPSGVESVTLQGFGEILVAEPTKDIIIDVEKMIEDDGGNFSTTTETHRVALTESAAPSVADPLEIRTAGVAQRMRIKDVSNNAVTNPTTTVNVNYAYEVRDNDD